MEMMMTFEDGILYGYRFIFIPEQNGFIEISENQISSFCSFEGSYFEDKHIHITKDFLLSGYKVFDRERWRIFRVKDRRIQCESVRRSVSKQLNMEVERNDFSVTFFSKI